MEQRTTYSEYIANGGVVSDPIYNQILNNALSAKQNFGFAAPANTPNLGSASVYDEGFVSGLYNQEEMRSELDMYRGEQQAWGTQLLFGAGRLVGTLGTKIGSGFTSVLGGAAGLLGEAFFNTSDGGYGKALMDGIDNPMTRALNSIEEGIKEELPVYKSRTYTQGDTWERFFTTSFLADELVDGLAFLGSAYYGGGLATKGASAAIKGLGLANGAKKLGGLIGETLYKGVDAAERVERGFGTLQRVPATIYNTFAEGAAEGKEVRDKVRNELTQLRELAKTGQIPDAQKYASMTDEEIEARSVSAGINTLGANAALLTLGNYWETGLFGIGKKNMANVAAETLNTSRLGVLGERIAALEGSLQDLGKLSSKEKFTAFRNKALEGFLAEGFEENAQLAVSKAFEADAKIRESSIDKIKEVYRNFYKNDQEFADLKANEEYQRLNENAFIIPNIAKNYAAFAESIFSEVKADSDKGEAALSIALGATLGMSGAAGFKDKYIKDKIIDQLSTTKEIGRIKEYLSHFDVAENVFRNTYSDMIDTDGNGKATINHAKVLSNIRNQEFDRQLAESMAHAAIVDDAVAYKELEELSAVRTAHSILSNKHNKTNEDLSFATDYMVAQMKRAEAEKPMLEKVDTDKLKAKVLDYIGMLKQVDNSVDTIGKEIQNDITLKNQQGKADALAKQKEILAQIEPEKANLSQLKEELVRREDSITSYMEVESNLNKLETEPTTLSENVKQFRIEDFRTQKQSLFSTEEEVQKEEAALVQLKSDIGRLEESIKEKERETSSYTEEAMPTYFDAFKTSIKQALKLSMFRVKAINETKGLFENDADKKDAYRKNALERELAFQNSLSDKAKIKAMYKKFVDLELEYRNRKENSLEAQEMEEILGTTLTGESLFQSGEKIDVKNAGLLNESLLRDKDIRDNERDIIGKGLSYRELNAILDKNGKYVSSRTMDSLEATYESMKKAFEVIFNNLFEGLLALDVITEEEQEDEAILQDIIDNPINYQNKLIQTIYGLYSEYKSSKDEVQIDEDIAAVREKFAIAMERFPELTKAIVSFIEEDDRTIFNQIEVDEELFIDDTKELLFEFEEYNQKLNEINSYRGIVSNVVIAEQSLSYRDYAKERIERILTPLYKVIETFSDWNKIDDFPFTDSDLIEINRFEESKWLAFIELHDHLTDSEKAKYLAVVEEIKSNKAALQKAQSQQIANAKRRNSEFLSDLLLSTLKFIRSVNSKYGMGTFAEIRDIAENDDLMKAVEEEVAKLKSKLSIKHPTLKITDLDLNYNTLFYTIVTKMNFIPAKEMDSAHVIEYLNTGNARKLLEALKGNKNYEFFENAEKFASLSFSLAAAKALKASNGNSHFKAFQGVINNIPDTDKKPSYQQFIVALEIALALDNPNSSVTVTNGTGGSGKTSMVAPLVLKSIKAANKNAKVAVIAHTEESTNNLINELGDKDLIPIGKDLLENSSSKPFLEWVKQNGITHIIVDEAFGFNAVALDTLSKSKAYKRIYLGDMSQMSPSFTNDVFSGEFVTLTNSLSINFRSSVTPILQFMSLFKNKLARVTPTMIAHSKEKRAGVKRSNDLIADIDAALAINRTVMVVVNGEKDKSRYAKYKGNKNVLVMPAFQVQGLQADEVILDIGESAYFLREGEMLPMIDEDIMSSKKEKMRNKFFYTLTSRPKKMLVLNDKVFPEAKEIVNEDIEDSIAVASELISDIGTQFGIIKKFLGTTLRSAPASNPIVTTTTTTVTSPVVMQPTVVQPATQIQPIVRQPTTVVQQPVVQQPVENVVQPQDTTKPESIASETTSTGEDTIQQKTQEQVVDKDEDNGLFTIPADTLEDERVEEEATKANFKDDTLSKEEEEQEAEQSSATDNEPEAQKEEPVVTYTEEDIIINHPSNEYLLDELEEGVYILQEPKGGFYFAARKKNSFEYLVLGFLDQALIDKFQLTDRESYERKLVENNQVFLNTVPKKFLVEGLRVNKEKSNTLKVQYNPATKSTVEDGVKALALGSRMSENLDKSPLDLLKSLKPRIGIMAGSFEKEVKKFVNPDFVKTIAAGNLLLLFKRNKNKALFLRLKGKPLRKDSATYSALETIKAAGIAPDSPFFNAFIKYMAANFKAENGNIVWRSDKDYLNQLEKFRQFTLDKANRKITFVKKMSKEDEMEYKDALAFYIEDVIGQLNENNINEHIPDVPFASLLQMVLDNYFPNRKKLTNIQAQEAFSFITAHDGNFDRVVSIKKGSQYSNKFFFEVTINGEKNNIFFEAVSSKEMTLEQLKEKNFLKGDLKMVAKAGEEVNETITIPSLSPSYYYEQLFRSLVAGNKKLADYRFSKNKEGSVIMPRPLMFGFGYGSNNESRAVLAKVSVMFKQALVERSVNVKTMRINSMADIMDYINLYEISFDLKAAIEQATAFIRISNNYNNDAKFLTKSGVNELMSMIEQGELNASIEKKDIVNTGLSYEEKMKRKALTINDLEHINQLGSDTQKEQMYQYVLDNFYTDLSNVRQSSVVLTEKKAVKEESIATTDTQKEKPTDVDVEDTEEDLTPIIDNEDSEDNVVEPSIDTKPVGTETLNEEVVVEAEEFPLGNIGLITEDKVVREFPVEEKEEEEEPVVETPTGKQVFGEKEARENADKYDLNTEKSLAKYGVFNVLANIDERETDVPQETKDAFREVVIPYLIDIFHKEAWDNSGEDFEKYKFNLFVKIRDYLQTVANANKVTPEMNIAYANEQLGVNVSKDKDAIDLLAELFFKQNEDEEYLYYDESNFEPVSENTDEEDVTDEEEDDTLFSSRKRGIVPTGEKWTQEKAVQYIRRMVPRLDKRSLLRKFLEGIRLVKPSFRLLDNVHFVSELELMQIRKGLGKRENPNLDYFGLMANGHIYLIQDANNKSVYANVVREEVVHLISQHFIPTGDRNRMRRLLEGKLGTTFDNVVEYEEALADTFIAHEKDSSILGRWVTKIKSFLGFANQYKNDLQGYFKLIQANYFKEYYNGDNVSLDASLLAELRGIKEFRESGLSIFNIFNAIRKALIENVIEQDNDRLPLLEQIAIRSLNKPFKVTAESTPVERLVADYFNDPLEKKPKEKKKREDLKYAILSEIVPMVLTKETKNYFLLQRDKDAPTDQMEIKDAEQIDIMDTPTVMLKTQLSMIENGFKKGTFLSIDATMNLVRNLFAGIDMSYILPSMKQTGKDYQDVKYFLTQEVKRRLDIFTNGAKLKPFKTFIDNFLENVQSVAFHEIEVYRKGYNEYGFFKLTESFLDKFKAYNNGVAFSLEEAMKKEYIKKHEKFLLENTSKENFILTTPQTFEFYVAKTEVENVAIKDSLYEFVTQDNVSTFTKKTFREYLQYSYSMDLLIGIHNLIGSSRHTTHVEHVEETYFENNTKKTRMNVNVKRSDWSGEELLNNISSLFIGLDTDLFNNAFIKELLPLIPSSNKDIKEDKALEIADFINQNIYKLGIDKSFNLSISASNLSKNSQEKNALLAFKHHLIEAKKINEIIAKNENTNVTLYIGSADEALIEAATQLVKLMVVSKDRISSDTYTTPEGKKTFTFIQGTFVHDVFTYLKNRIRMPYMMTDFFKKYNPFIANNYVFDFYYYGGWKTKDGDKSNVYKAETLHDFIRRNFVYNFFVKLNETKGKHYDQTLYTMSDREKMIHVTIPFLGEEGLVRNRIEDMLRQKMISIANLDKNKFNNYAKNDENWFNMDVFEDGVSILDEFKERFVEYARSGVAIDKIVGSYFDPIIDKLMQHFLEVESPKVIRAFFDEEVSLPSDMEGFIEVFDEVLTKEEKESILIGGKEYLAGKLKKDEESIAKGKVARQNLETAFAKIVPIMLMNNYVNGYFLDQTFAGDYAAYKSVDDIVKRLQGQSAAGIAPVVRTGKYGKGMKENFNILFSDDSSIRGAEKSVEDNIEIILQRHKIFLSNVEEETQETVLDDKGKEVVVKSMERLSDKEIADRLNKLKEKLLLQGSEYDYYMDKYTPTTVAFLRKVFQRSDKNISKEELDSKIDRAMKYFQEKGYDVTDAQAFATPHFLEELKKGYDPAFGLGRVLKFVYSAILRVESEGTWSDDKSTFYPTPIYLKNSIVILDDELIARFPELQRIRETLERTNSDVLSLSTGTKLGFLKSAKPFDAIIGQSKEKMLDDLRPMAVPSKYLRMQQNPQAKLDKDIALFTQILYFISVDNNNKPMARKRTEEVYDAMSLLLNRLFLKEEKKTVDAWTTQSESSLRNDLIEYFSRQEEKENILRLLNSTEKLSALPLLDQIVTAISSQFTNSVSKFKFSGSKLTLQTQQGAMTYKDIDGKIIDKPLEMRVMEVNDKTILVSDAIVSWKLLDEEQQAYFRKHKRLEMFANGDFFGFRLPSTGPNSGLLINIVGFLDESMGSNQIIVAKEVVPLHGSDFDVDSLFFIRREVFDEEEQSLMEDEMSKEGKTDYSRYAGYKFDGLTDGVDLMKFDFQPLLTALDKAEESVNQDIAAAIKNKKDLTLLLKKTTMPAKKAQVEKSIKENDERLDSKRKKKRLINDMYIKVLKNTMIDGVMSVLADEKNRTRMAQALSMEMINGTVSGEKNPYKKNSVYYLLHELGHGLKMKLNLSLPLDLYVMQKSVFDGNDGTGIFANGAKSTAYNNNAGSTVIVLSAEELREKNLPAFKKKMVELYDETQAQLIVDKTVLLRKKITDANLTKNSLSKLLKDKDPSVDEIRELILELLSYRKSELAVRQKPKISVKYQFTLDRKLFDGFPTEETTHIKSNEISVWEIWETLINLSIDNAKEKGLGNMNANTHTFKFYVGGTALGMDLNTQVIIAKQPILMLFNNRRFNRSTFDYNLREMAKVLLNLYARKTDSNASEDTRLEESKQIHLLIGEISKILELQNVVFSSGYENFIETSNTKVDTLIHYLDNNKEDGKTSRWKLLEKAIYGDTDAYSKLDVEYIKQQMVALVLFYKVTVIGRHISTSSKNINVIKEQKTTVADILQSEEDVIDSGVTITNETPFISSYRQLQEEKKKTVKYTLFELSKNPLNVGNFARINPHIDTAMNYSFALKKRLGRLKLLSQTTLDKVNDIKKNTNIRYAFSRSENTYRYIREYAAIMQGLLFGEQIRNKVLTSNGKKYYGINALELELKGKLASLKSHLVGKTHDANFFLEHLNTFKMSLGVDSFNDEVIDMITTGLNAALQFDFELVNSTKMRYKVTERETASINRELLNQLIAYSIYKEGLSLSPRKIGLYLSDKLTDFLEEYDKFLEEDKQKEVEFAMIRRSGTSSYPMKPDGDIGFEGSYEMKPTEGKEIMINSKGKQTDLQHFRGETKINGRTLYYDLEMEVNGLTTNELIALGFQETDKAVMDKINAAKEANEKAKAERKAAKKAAKSKTTDEEVAAIEEEENTTAVEISNEQQSEEESDYDEEDTVALKEQMKDNITKKAFRFKGQLYKLLDYVLKPDGKVGVYYVSLGKVTDYLPYPSRMNKALIEAYGSVKQVIRYGTTLSTTIDPAVPTVIIDNNDAYATSPVVVYKEKEFIGEDADHALIAIKNEVPLDDICQSN